MTRLWKNWRDMVNNGRIRKRMENPTRERLLVRTALDTLGLNYRELVPAWNPFYKDGAVQWLDFLAMAKGRMCAILLLPKYKSAGMKPADKEALDAKLRLLRERNIPSLVVPRNWSGTLYEAKIRMFIGTLEERRLDE